MVKTYKSNKWCWFDINTDKTVKAYDLIKGKMQFIGWLWYEFGTIILLKK